MPYHDKRTDNHKKCREPSRACEHVKEEAHSDTEDERTHNAEAKAFDGACHLHAQVKLFEPFKLAFLVFFYRIVGLAVGMISKV